MSVQAAEVSGYPLPCYRCGYDLRAHPDDGQCPECGASVAESRRLNAIPARPSWRDSDRRWRRRMLAGAWVLVLLPLVDALKRYGWASEIRVPTIFDYRGTVRSLQDTLITLPGVYQPLVFCIGVVLLFSKERGRRSNRLDWTRRWGVICSYVVLLLSAAEFLLVPALVLAGIAAVFHSMPLKYEPPVTRLFVELSSAFLRIGHLGNGKFLALVAFSSITMLLACVPVFDALRSSGPGRFALILLVPIALFALWLIVQAASYGLGLWKIDPNEFSFGVYFRPSLLVNENVGGVVRGWDVFLVEAAKWLIFLAIAIWLTAAQIASIVGRQPRRRAGHERADGARSSAIFGQSESTNGHE